jgi:hypothetical protein
MTPLTLVTALSSTGLSAMDFHHTVTAMIAGALGLAGHALLVRPFRAGEASVTGAVIIILSSWLMLSLISQGRRLLRKTANMTAGERRPFASRLDRLLQRSAADING